MEVNDSEKTKHREKTSAQQSENPWENHYQFFAEFSSSSETFSVEDFSRVLRKSGHCMYVSEYLQLQCGLDALQTAKLQWRRWGRGGLLCTFWKKQRKAKKYKLESSKWAQKNTLNSQKQFPSQLDYEKQKFKIQRVEKTSWVGKLSTSDEWTVGENISVKKERLWGVVKVVATLTGNISCMFVFELDVETDLRWNDLLRFHVHFGSIHAHACSMHKHMAKLWNIRQNFFKHRKHVGKTLSGKEWWKVVQFPLR